MINVFLFLTAIGAADTSRCTWEGRLPDRGHFTVVVSQPGQVNRLTSMFRGGSKHDRQMAMRALGQLGDPAAIPVLAEGSADSSKHVASEAAWALGRISDRRVAPLLLTALKSTDQHVLQAAACGLGRTAGTQAIVPLQELLRSSDPFVAEAARWSIERIRALPFAYPGASNKP